MDTLTDLSAGFNFTAAIVGDTYAYSITSSGGGTPITGSGSVTSATQSVGEIKVASLNDGTLTYSVTLSDSVGNTGAAATATALLDRVPPSGYSLATNQTTITTSNETSVGYTIAAQRWAQLTTWELPAAEAMSIL